MIQGGNALVTLGTPSETWAVYMQNIMARAEASQLIDYSAKIMTPQRCSPVIGTIQDSLLALHFLVRERVDVDTVYDAVMNATTHWLAGPTEVDTVHLPLLYERIYTGRVVLDKGRLRDWFGRFPPCIRKWLRSKGVAVGSCDNPAWICNLPEYTRRWLLRDCMVLTQQHRVDADLAVPEPVLKTRLASWADTAYTRVNTVMEQCNTMQRWQSLLQRCIQHYPQDVARDGEMYRLTPDRDGRVDGRILYSFILPQDFYMSRDGVQVRSGVLLPDSAVPKKALAPGGVMLSSLCTNYSLQQAQLCISFAQQISYTFLSRRSLSVGVKDCLLTPEAREQVSKAVQDSHNQCAIISANPSRDAELQESQLNAQLNSATSISATLANKGVACANNAFHEIRMSGAKGSEINLGQIAALVGQQNVNGERAKLHIRGERALPCMVPNSTDPAARGFITASYFQGLDPEQVFFHSQAGRRGVVDTGLKTRKTGYVYKRVAKKLEDYRVEIDGTVRNSQKQILQFLYGEDGLDSGKLGRTNGPIPLPFDPHVVAGKLSGELPVQPIPLDEVRAWCKTVMMGQPGFQSSVTRRAKHNMVSVLQPILAQVHCAPERRVLFWRECTDRFEQSKACAGEMAGLSCTFSITEPSTQMVLSSFKFCGIGEKDITVGGVPRMEEITGANKVPSVPIVSCSLVSKELDTVAKRVNTYRRRWTSLSAQEKLACEVDWAEAISICESFGNTLVQQSIQSITSCTRVYSWMHSESGAQPFQPQWWNRAPWNKPCTTPSFVVHVELDKDKLYRYRVDQAKIVSIIRQHIPFDSCLIHTSPTAVAQLDLFLDVQELEETEGDGLDALANVMVPQLLLAHVQGIVGVQEVYVKESIVEGDIHWGLTVRLDGNSKPGQGYSLLLIHPRLYNCVSNNVWELLSHLGVQACREYMIQELTRVLSFDGTYINSRHIVLLVDAMLLYGTVSACKSDSIGRETGPVAKGMFEKNVGNFCYAGTYAEADNLGSLSASVLMGIPSKSGCGRIRREPVSKDTWSQEGYDPSKYREQCCRVHIY